MKFKALAVALLCVTILNAQTPEPFPFAPELFPNGESGGIAGFAPNGKTIYFIREDLEKKKLFIYEAARERSKWTKSTLLPFSGSYGDMGARLSADGSIMYFTSDRPGGSDRSDDVWNLWMTEKRKGKWLEPVPYKTVNNKGMECCLVPIDKSTFMFSSDRSKPTSWWISVYDQTSGTETLADSLNASRAWQWPSFLIDQNTLLLNSMGRTDNLGMDDIYISFRRNGKWTKPVNLGAPVNTKIYEDGAILTPDKKYLVYNQHETAETPSKVMAKEWEPIYRELIRKVDKKITK
jgi:hypothetical protein